MNKAILIGNIGSDPELKVSASGFATLKFSLATSEKYKNKDGEPVEKTDWHRVTILGKRAEGLASHIIKGQKLMVEGKIRVDQVEKDDGAKMTYVNIEVGQFDGGIEFLSKKEEGGAPRPPRDTQRNLKAVTDFSDPTVGDDDPIPF